MKRILVAEPEQAVNKKVFAIHTVIGDCSAANHRHEHQQGLEIISSFTVKVFWLLKFTD